MDKIIHPHNLLSLSAQPSTKGLAPLCLDNHKSGRQFMTSGQNWICPMPPHLPAALEMVDKTVFRFVHRLPISTCENAKVDKSGRFFRIFYFFFYFFSYTPFYLLLCYYPFFTKHPHLSAIMRFFHFFDPFFTLFCTFSHPYNRERSIQSPNHDDSKPLSRADARTHPTPAHFFYLFLVLTCERPLHLPKMGFWVCVYRY